MTDHRFIELHTYKTERHPDKERGDVHKKLLVNPSHIVYAAQVFKLSQDKSLKTVELSGVHLFGQGTVDCVETVDEIEEQIERVNDD